MSPCKAQNVQPSILVGTQENALNDRLMAGPTNEGGCGGMPSLLDGWSLI
jgi:hypothetical protein